MTDYLMTMNQKRTMKKTLVLLALIIAAFTQIKAQEASFGIHGSYFGRDSKKASNLGVGMSISYEKFYLDFAGNFAKGKGQYLDFSTSYSYPADKISFFVFNVGYILNINKIHIIPLIGYGAAADIYEDPVGWDTYYIGRSTIFNAGIIIGATIKDVIKVYAGTGTFENAKFGIAYTFEMDP